MFGHGHAKDAAPEESVPARGHAATSDLSGQEFWLINDAGFQVLGLVLGNCVYSMGAVRNWLAGIKANFKGEIKEITQLMYDARELALQRMQAEADSLGADSVVGVDIKINYMHNDEWMEVTATGTAVRRVGPAQGRAQVTINAG
jgi:uncharacterized protein YbjQ (UPF0145 family)